MKVTSTHTVCIELVCGYCLSSFLSSLWSALTTVCSFLFENAMDIMRTVTKLIGVRRKGHQDQSQGPIQSPLVSGGSLRERYDKLAADCVMQVARMCPTQLGFNFRKGFPPKECCCLKQNGRTKQTSIIAAKSLQSSSTHTFPFACVNYFRLYSWISAH